MNYRGYKRWAIQCISPKEAIVNLNRLRTIHLFTLYQIIYTKYSLKFHIGRHTGEKPFSWTCCCKPFSHRYYLTRHMPSHNGEKPYSCVICNKLFFTKKWCEDSYAFWYRRLLTMQHIICSFIFFKYTYCVSYYRKTISMQVVQ